MPQDSYAYACGRIAVLSKRLLDSNAVRRMAEGSESDALRILSDLHYGGLSDLAEIDTERIIESEMTSVIAEIMELTPCREITDLFFLRADVQNLKILLKSRLLGRTAETWTVGGLFDREQLASMVKEQKYSGLPKVIMTELNALEKRLLHHVDPQEISVTLDRAYLQHCLNSVKKDPFFHHYFASMADFDNVLTFFRMRAMGAGVHVLEDVLLAEGGIRLHQFIDAYDLPAEAVNKLFHSSVCTDALLRAAAAMQKSGSINELEKAREDYLLSLFNDRRFESDSIYPIVGYYLAKERESRAVRLVLTAKRNHLPESMIRERLVKLYGER